MVFLIIQEDRYKDHKDQTLNEEDRYQHRGGSGEVNEVGVCVCVCVCGVLIG
jgi:hypothetical protein